MTDSRVHREMVCWSCGWECGRCEHGETLIPHRKGRRPYVMLSDSQIEAHRAAGHEVIAMEFRP